MLKSADRRDQISLTWMAVHPLEEVADEAHHLWRLQPPQRCLQDCLIMTCRQRRMQTHLLRIMGMSMESAADQDSISCQQTQPRAAQALACNNFKGFSPPHRPLSALLTVMLAHAWQKRATETYMMGQSTTSICMRMKAKRPSLHTEDITSHRDTICAISSQSILER